MHVSFYKRLNGNIGGSQAFLLTGFVNAVISILLPQVKNLKLLSLVMCKVLYLFIFCFFSLSPPSGVKMCDSSCRLWRFWNNPEPFPHFRVHDVNGPPANGRLNHGQAEETCLDCFFTSVLSFPRGRLLSGLQRERRRPAEKGEENASKWKAILQWELRAHLVSAQSLFVCALCRGVTELHTMVPSRWPETKPNTSKGRLKCTIVPNVDGCGTSSLF